MTVLTFFFADLSAPAAVLLAVSATATVSIPALLLSDAHRCDFPRVWQASVDARHTFDRALMSGLRWADAVVVDVQLALRDVALSAAALLALLTITPGDAR